MYIDLAIKLFSPNDICEEIIFKVKQNAIPVCKP